MSGFKCTGGHDLCPTMLPAPDCPYCEVEMTAAEARTFARDFERRLDWHAAAAHWQIAIDSYPTKGALAALDKRKMAAARDACLWMATRNTELPG